MEAAACERNISFVWTDDQTANFPELARAHTNSKKSKCQPFNYQDHHTTASFATVGNNTWLKTTANLEEPALNIDATVVGWKCTRMHIFLEHHILMETLFVSDVRTRKSWVTEQSLRARWVTATPVPTSIWNKKCFQLTALTASR